MKELSAEQLELLRRQMAEEGIDLSATQPIPRLSDRANLKLSFSQQQLWLLDQVEPGNPAYNIPSAIQLTGELNVAALKFALSEIERRHEALRTTFVAVDGEPRQVIRAVASTEVQFVDLEAYPFDERRREAKRLSAEESLRPFDLSRGPLFRATLFRLHDREHLLLVTTHHIISDGWSTRVLWGEFSKLYSAFLNGEPAALPELPVQYADFAGWQREQLGGEAFAKELDYWRRQLAGAPALLELPVSRTRPAVQRSGEAVVMLRLDQQVTDSLRQLSRAEGVTLFMTLASVFALLLSRHSGQEEIVMGTPVAGRNRRELEGLIGFFINTVVLRTDLRGDPPFRELLQRVREVCLKAYANQDVSFEKLIEELKPPRDQSHTPLFQVYLNMLSYERGEMKLPGVKAKAVGTPMLSKFDLTLYVAEDPTGIDFTVVHNPDLFERSAMAALLEELLHLCAQVGADPARKISLYSLVTPKAAALLPDPREPLGSRWEGSVQELFSQCAARWPGNLAVKDATESWSYEALDAQSNRLANYLLANGLQRQEVVAVYGQRSAALVWTVLGILKAGGVFCILDPSHPDARSIEYLSLAKPRGWLQAGDISRGLDEFVSSLAPRCRLTLSSEAEALRSCSTEAPAIAVGPDDLACLTFTSGSTGQPKGVLGRHQSLSHYAPWLAQTFHVDHSDRFSMLSNLSHDPLQRDIFTPLQLGGALCVPDPEEMGNPGWLAQWMAEEKVSVSNLTPAMIHLLTQTGAGLRIPSLRYAFVVGDVLTKNDVTRLRQLAPAVTCINLYGSTETQRALSYFVVPDEVSEVARESIPVGRGIDEVELLVLSDSQQLAGIGELGEISIRSPHLAKGYLDDDRLTAERFIINPFTKLAGDRLYRTGDLGFYLPDGNVSLVGRSDQQVQIRGFRVEPVEIETALKKDTRVRDCAVVAYQNGDGDKQLVAYVTQANGVAPKKSDLTRQLREQLPAYMVHRRLSFSRDYPSPQTASWIARRFRRPPSRGPRRTLTTLHRTRPSKR